MPLAQTMTLCHQVLVQILKKDNDAKIHKEIGIAVNINIEDPSSTAIESIYIKKEAQHVIYTPQTGAKSPDKFPTAPMCYQQIHNPR